MSQTTSPPYPVPPQPPTSQLAIWSLVLGLLSFVCFSIFTAIPAVICGHKALNRINSSGGGLTGKGLAIGGLEKGKTGGDVPTANDLTPYLAGGKFPVCPDGGIYTIGAVTNDPTCSVPGHELSQ